MRMQPLQKLLDLKGILKLKLKTFDDVLEELPSLTRGVLEVRHDRTAKGGAEVDLNYRGGRVVIGVTLTDNPETDLELVFMAYLWAYNNPDDLEKNHNSVFLIERELHQFKRHAAYLVGDVYKMLAINN